MESRDSDLAQVLAKYDKLVDWERRNRSAMKVDIAPLGDLLRQLNNPQKKFRTIHIAGTKGKGSVGALIEAGLHRAGLACGRFSSPHVLGLIDPLGLRCGLTRLGDKAGFQQSRWLGRLFGHRSLRGG